MKKIDSHNLPFGTKFTTQAPILKCKTQENTVVFFSYGKFVQNCELVFEKGYSITLVGVEFYC